jgi:hypothetical protein
MTRIGCLHCCPSRHPTQHRQKSRCLEHPPPHSTHDDGSTVALPCPPARVSAGCGQWSTQPHRDTTATRHHSPSRTNQSQASMTFLPVGDSPVTTQNTNKVYFLSRKARSSNNTMTHDGTVTMLFRICIAIVIAAVCATVHTDATVVACCSLSTLQTALGNAADGDVLELGAGVWTGVPAVPATGIDWPNGVAVTVRGAGIGVTVIDGGS